MRYRAATVRERLFVCAHASGRGSISTVQGIFASTFLYINAALGLSMLLYRPEWQERVKSGLRSATIATLTILILSLFSK